MISNFGKILITFSLGMVLIIGCKQMDEKQVVGFDLSNIDSTVTPNENFYDYSVGIGLKTIRFQMIKLDGEPLICLLKKRMIR